MPGAPPKDKALPPIPWSADNLALTWCLIGLVEEPENRKVVVGKGKSEVKSNYCFQSHNLHFHLHRTQVERAKPKSSSASQKSSSLNTSRLIPRLSSV
jgi:hypothetical protein